MKQGKVEMTPPVAAAGAVLPVGFRFRPTDEELVRHYLKGKIAGRIHPDLLLIPDVDLSTCEPWDLPAMSVIKSDDPEWFFFAPRDRKYPGGHRSNRSTAAGYWKATGKDRLIRSRPAGPLIGIKKTLVFHRGRAPRGIRTAWIMHEYRTTEPHFQSGKNGSFLLYRLFNKHEQDDTHTPASNLEQQLHSMSPSPVNPQNGTDAVKVALASIMKDHETLPSSDLSQLTEIQNATTTDDADQSMARSPADDKEQTVAHDDAFLDVLSQLPDLEPEQTYNGFPNITSPMCPYSDDPFVGNLGEQDLSAHFGSILSEQDLQSLLFTPNYTKMDKHPTGNVGSNPTTSSNNPNNNTLLMDSWRKNGSYQMLPIQHADDTDATCCSSSINAPQTETSDANLEARAQSCMVYSGVAEGSHLCNQDQLHSAFNPHMVSQKSGAFCWAGLRTPYPQHWFNTMVEPGRSGMTFSDALKEQDQEQAPSMQHLTAQDLVDPRQGTAARRIRLVCSVQRASISQHVSTSHLQSEYEAGSCCNTLNSSNNKKEKVRSEDEVGSCCNTGSSSNNHSKENDDAASQIMVPLQFIDGEPMHIQCKEDTPIQVDPSVEVMDKLQGFSFHEEMLAHANQPRGTNLKQRLLRVESRNINENNTPSLETRGRQHAPHIQIWTSSVVRLGWGWQWPALFVMAGSLLLLVGIWKWLNHTA
uniref:NAC domain-containing protein n=1 Tax=Oryza punctata TaxID=4537 RepID=A0A0E0L6P4_ORYPU